MVSKTTPLTDPTLSKTLQVNGVQKAGALAPMQTFSSSAWIHTLPAELRTALMSLARPKTYTDGQLLFAKGEAPEGLYYVGQGEVRASSLNFEGKEVVVYYFEKGSWLGLISAFDCGQSPVDCRSVGETHIQLVTNADLHKLLERMPQFYPHFTKLLCIWLRVTIEFIEDSVLLKLRTRIAKRLLGLAEAYGKPVDNGILINLHLPQDELGRMMGATRQSINKELKCLQDMGWIAVVHGSVVLCEIEKLQYYVDQNS